MQIVGAHEQGTKEWKDARTGAIGASEIHRIMTAGTKALETLRKEFRQKRELGKERSFSSEATEWGKRYEKPARVCAEIDSGIDFQEVGLVVHDELFYVGASPDGLNFEQQVGLELKCPFKPQNHLAMVEKIPNPYIWQCQAGMWVTGYKRWLFASFDPRLSAETPAPGEPPRDLIMHWIERSDRMVAQMEERIPWFWSTI